MVLLTNKKTGRPYNTPQDVRKNMLELWLKGYTYMELAQKFTTYRQKTRAIILGFNPSFEEFKKHDENRRIRQLANKLNAND